ncbi:TetR/AcrR family transcriptional regulator [Flavivirga amylovorans]|uniref:TetR/AcrR family transcriptional regulator n=1 Tax=Flavivirga amylovorans TaxID=870486 RepID=A0ABT8WXP8_9FLAO|nr:TetR/AcrR family transcriptional regulator [Flavivirga amylovorans]MDO5986460.1 TetR/AcrR family transcriptional regulator [Flavivirga amylovorans]
MSKKDSHGSIISYSKIIDIFTDRMVGFVLISMSDKKNKVLQIATKLFAEKGFENTSMVNICHEANVSKGLIYHHFKSKESILIEIFTGVTNQMIEMKTASKSSQEPKLQLVQLIETIFSQLEHDKAFFQLNLNIMFQPSTRQILKEQIEQRASLLFNSVKNIFDQISLKKSDLLSYMFIAEIDGISLNYLSIFNEYPLDMVKEELINKYKYLRINND